MLSFAQGIFLERTEINKINAISTKNKIIIHKFTMKKQIETLSSNQLFAPRQFFRLGGYFIVAIVFLNNIFKEFCMGILALSDCPRYWPISEFELHAPRLSQILVAICVSLFFSVSIFYLAKIRYRLPDVILIGFILIMGSNLTQGWIHGFITPTADWRQYYAEAIRIKSAMPFLIDFEMIQPELGTHGATHPPGATLLYYFLYKLFGRPEFISLAILIIALPLSSFFFYKIISVEFPPHLSGYLTLLFILLPSVQIYYLATIDALITCFLLGTLYFFLHPKFSVSVIGGIICLFFASFMTFGFLFMIPIIVGFDIIHAFSSSLKGSESPHPNPFPLKGRGKGWGPPRSAIIMIGLVLIYLWLYFTFDFNYLNSFFMASSIENPDGFRLFTEPINYVLTRIEGIFEIILFFGPFLGILAIRGMLSMRKLNSTFFSAKDKSSVLFLTCLAIATLLAMFATGAYRTGETARVCMFMYPFLLFPVASYLNSLEIFGRKEQIILASSIFAQTIIMQLMGNYIW
ncbi:MAG: hypothetical protein B6242_11750 [Anaerolineaceae bacterium 4572_78]|nr:MAG: hypothetical protein B6242_11750 [Anaerolineaceae bacterium 4572_78]